MTLAECTEAVRLKLAESEGLNAVLKFDCGSDGVILVDAVSRPHTVSNEDRSADCTIAISLDDLASLVGGTLDPTTAFMTGKLSVEGDVSVAMRLAQVV
jgi:putative sterol carrier protein